MRQLLADIRAALGSAYGKSYLAMPPPQTPLPYLIIEPNGGMGVDWQKNADHQYTATLRIRVRYLGQDASAALVNVEAVVKICEAMTTVMAVHREAPNLEQDPDPGPDGMPVWQAINDLNIQVQRTKGGLL
jgi:hypothetical protein